MPASITCVPSDVESNITWLHKQTAAKTLCRYCTAKPFSSRATFNYTRTASNPLVAGVSSCTMMSSASENRSTPSFTTYNGKGSRDSLGRLTPSTARAREESEVIRLSPVRQADGTWLPGCERSSCQYECEGFCCC